MSWLRGKRETGSKAPSTNHPVDFVYRLGSLSSTPSEEAALRAYGHKRPHGLS